MDTDRELREKLQRAAEEAQREIALETCKAALRIAKRTREQHEEKRRRRQ